MNDAPWNEIGDEYEANIIVDGTPYPRHFRLYEGPGGQFGWAYKSASDNPAITPQGTRSSADPTKIGNMLLQIALGPLKAREDAISGISHPNVVIGNNDLVKKVLDGLKRPHK